METNKKPNKNKVIFVDEDSHKTLKTEASKRGVSIKKLIKDITENL